MMMVYLVLLAAAVCSKSGKGNLIALLEFRTSGSRYKSDFYNYLAHLLEFCKKDKDSRYWIWCELCNVRKEPSLLVLTNKQNSLVLLAAAVCSKSGKAIISRQFVEMTRARIEGLLAAFPKLLGSGRQHTFVETESVRYVYQPLEKLYMLLITTRASNILEDLETLRLFSRVIPEYCKNMDEQDITENSFNLIFAFDEIVALGYRENVNLAQIRTFVEMDSHEEKVYQAIRQTQEREAKQKMKEKARELQRARQDAAKKGRTPGFGSGGFGSGNMAYPSSPMIGDTAPSVQESPKTTYVPPR
ncbi:coatomer subunit delta-like [Centruroides sculpturatus]|uniref:coatomer subunit delta-like n=1 Tax=Centruroides sculpturatus TaxID=218467 RepID=UPI000C6D63B7|nr:coatomer subunit delta-like [Centruroides sculpturatus]